LDYLLKFIFLNLLDMKDPLLQIVYFLAFAIIAFIIIKGLLLPASKNQSKTVGETIGGESRTISSVLSGWKKSRWFWNITQFLFVLSLKVVTVIVLATLKFELSNEAISLLPLLFTVWLSGYIIFKEKSKVSRWVVGGAIYLAQVLLGLILGMTAF
jgi:hypothetical protein